MKVKVTYINNGQVLYFSGDPVVVRAEIHKAFPWLTERYPVENLNKDLERLSRQQLLTVEVE